MALHVGQCWLFQMFGRLISVFLHSSKDGWEIGFSVPLAQTGISERAVESRYDGSRTGVWQSFTRLGQHQKQSKVIMAQESFPQRQERQPGELSTPRPSAFFLHNIMNSTLQS